MVRVYCQECVSEFIVDNYESHPGICLKCMSKPCKVCGEPRNSKKDYCSAACKSADYYANNKAKVLEHRKGYYNKKKGVKICG